MRPALDSPRGARFLMPATQHTARITLRPRLTAADRPLIAAKLATGFKPGSDDDATMRDAVARIRRAALATAERLAATTPTARLGVAVDAAVSLQRRLTSPDVDDRACLGVAVVRELLTDAPDACCDLDRAVRDAAAIHAHRVEERHVAEALRVIAEVLG